jgi:hypothetical protein
MSSDDYRDPARLMRAAIARITEALADFDDSGAGPDVLAALEKAHYRIETAQREIADAYTDGAPADAWEQVGDATGTTGPEARARFTESAWLGR